jgi:hypothetical protein
MVVTDSRTAPTRTALAVLLLVVLTLTACGRGGTPRVTAEDGRGGDGRTDTIWIPETRNVDAGTDTRSDDEDRPEPRLEARRGDSDAGERRSATPRTTAASSREDEDRPSSDGGAPEPAERRSTGSSASNGTQASAPTTSRETSDRPAPPPEDTGPEEASPEEPTDPEPSGGCGTARDQHEPSRAEVERAASELADEVARRWPDTHGGVWVTEGARPEVHAAFTRQVGQSLAELCGSFEYPHLLHGVEVELSAKELGELRAHVLDERDALRQGNPPDDLPEIIRTTEGRYLVEVDEPRNALVIVLEEPTDELQRAFRNRYTHRLHTVRGPVEEDHGDEAARQRQDEGAG